MNKYAEIAVKAGQYVENLMTPNDAWEKARYETDKLSKSLHKKNCPKNAFLGLYGGKGISAEYAKKGLSYLKANPDRDFSSNALWEIVMEGKKKAQNQRMDVVIALYNARLR